MAEPAHGPPLTRRAVSYQDDKEFGTANSVLSTCSPDYAGLSGAAGVRVELWNTAWAKVLNCSRRHTKVTKQFVCNASRMICCQLMEFAAPVITLALTLMVLLFHEWCAEVTVDGRRRTAIRRTGDRWSITWQGVSRRWLTIGTLFLVLFFRTMLHSASVANLADSMLSTAQAGITLAALFAAHIFGRAWILGGDISRLAPSPTTLTNRTHHADIRLRSSRLAKLDAGCFVFSALLFVSAVWELANGNTV